MRMPVRDRIAAVMLLLASSGFSWFAMMIVHELGHVATAWLTGGRVSRVILHPLALSRTDLAHNPHPLIVSWGGPAAGISVPLAIWLCMCGFRSRFEFLARFWAGLCLIANGAYLGSAVVMPVGDAEDLLRHGAPLWTLVLVGVAGVFSGLAMWNRLGAKFGFAGEPADRTALVMMVALFLVVMIALLTWSWLT